MTSTLKADKIEGVTASGTVQMPEGSVIQMQTGNYTSNVNILSTSFIYFCRFSIFLLKFL